VDSAAGNQTARRIIASGIGDPHARRRLGQPWLIATVPGVGYPIDVIDGD
jgi:hypothetical protein